MKSVVLVWGLLNLAHVFSVNFDPLRRVESGPIYLVSPGDDTDEDSYSVVVMTDKRTGVQILDEIPKITRDAVECVAMANRYNTPIYYSYEKLASDWYQTDDRFTYPDLDLLIKKSYTPCPSNSYLSKTSEGSRCVFVPKDKLGRDFHIRPSDDEWREWCWESLNTDLNVRRFYEHSVKYALQYHLVFGSAAHYGFVRAHFDYGYDCGDTYDEFVKLVGPAPKVSDLPQIASFKSNVISANKLIYKNNCFRYSVKKMIEYVALMSNLPVSEIAKYFEKE